MPWTTPRTWSSSERPTTQQFNDHISQNVLALRWVLSTLTEDIVVNTSTAYEDLTGLTFKVREGERWQFWANIYFVTNAAADIKLTVTAPSASTGRFGGLHSLTTNVMSTTTFGGDINFAVTGADQETCALSGLVVAGSDGKVQVQGSQLASTAVNTTFYADSWLVAFRRAS